MALLDKQHYYNYIYHALYLDSGMISIELKYNYSFMYNYNYVGHSLTSLIINYIIMTTRKCYSTERVKVHLWQFCIAEIHCASYVCVLHIPPLHKRNITFGGYLDGYV